MGAGETPPSLCMRDLQALTEAAFRTHREGSLDTAESMYDSLLSQLTEPDFNVLYGYGSLMVQKEKFGVGLSLLCTAEKLYPRHPGLLCNMGVAYKYLGREDAARVCYEKAFAIEQSAEVLCGMAGYYVNRDESETAERYARKSLAKADLPAAHMHLALALLEQGRFDEAWPHYEARWDSADRLKWKRHYNSQKWDGKSVKKLVIHGEQGLGDEIMFMSLFSKAKERAEEIVIECADRLTGIFSKAFNCRCYGTEAELKANESPEDAHIAMGSLPSLVGMPSGTPFMPRPSVVNVGKPTIGIAWRGGTTRTNKDFRTLRLEQLKPILTSIDANFISVQYGGAEVDQELDGYFAIKSGPRDLDSLHYRIGICDLVVTVTQTAVHQAGAMGVPCWVLTPRKSSWPFMTEKMLWYNSVELFKQRGDEGWDPVIGAMASELRRRYGDVAA